MNKTARMERTEAKKTAWPRTVYIAHWLPLSSETFVYYEAEGLLNRGFPVSGATLYGKRNKELSPHFLNARLPVERLGILGAPRVLAAVYRAFIVSPRESAAIIRDMVFRRWRNLELQLENSWACLCGFYFARRFAEQGVEHVHAAWANGPATAAWVVKRLTGIPFSLSVHAGDVRPPDGGLAEKLAAADFARADSAYNIPWLARFEPGGSGNKHHLVYNVRTLSPKALAAVPMARPCRLLCVGRLVDTKGFDYAIEALSLLPSRGVTAELYLAGSGTEKRRLQRKARRLGLKDKVHFLGFVTHDAIEDLMLAADIFLMPSVVRQSTGKSDGLPTVIVEAMLHGLPVISTDVASIGDVVRHEETGLMVPERNAPALADAVACLVRDRDRAMTMARKAGELVRELFDTDANLARLMALFAAHAGKGERAAAEEDAFSWPVALIIPFTGRSPDMEAALHTLLRQDYPALDVLLVTQGEADPAAQLARELAAAFPRTRHILAGRATQCGQKNRNLLDALARTAPDTAIYAFCDANHLAGPDFVRQLVRPILSGRAAFSSGYRRTRLCAHEPASVSCHLLVRIMGLLQSLPVFTQPWGGAMAMDAAAFHAFNVAELWSRTVADDCSLAGLLRRKGVRTAFCPEAMLDSPIRSMSKDRLRAWFFRQIIGLRLYTFPVWLLLGMAMLCLCLITVAGAGLIIAWLGGAGSFGVFAGAAAGCFLALAALQEIFRRRIAPDCPRTAWLSGLGLAVRAAVSMYWRTIRARSIVWHHLRYQLTTDGRVLRVENADRDA